MKLCLDSLTLTDTEPVDLIRSARKAGFDLVSLWVQPPSLFPSQLVTRAKGKTCIGALADNGISVGPLEVFDLSSAEAVKSYRPALELGAQLGAKTASAINVHNPDPADVSELFAQLAELAGEYGLGVTLEPLAMFATSTLAQARDIIRSSGVEAGIVLDAFHLVRMGGTAADVRSMEPGLIRHIQLCDGLASVSLERAHYESVNERLYPGEGEFALVELLSNSHALSFNLATYYYKYTDLQVTSYGIGPENVPIAEVTNAANSRIYGVEGDVRYEIFRGFEVNANAAYLNAKYTSFPNAPGNAPCFTSPVVCGANYGQAPPVILNLSGSRMQRAPEVTSSLGARYTMQVARGHLAFSGNLYYTSNYFEDLGDQIRQPAYATLGLRAEWTDPSDRLTLAVYGDNVTDKRYYFSGQTSSASYPVVWAAPAMIFGEIKYRFH